MAVINKRDTVLVVDDEEKVCGLLSARLSAGGYRCLVSSNSIEAMGFIESQDIAVVLLDINLPCRSSLQVFQEIRAESRDTAIIMVAEIKEIESAIQCVRLGAYDYVTKPFNPDGVALSVRRALEKRRLELENREYQRTLELRVTERTRELTQTVAKIKTASVDTIIRLSRAAEYKDEDTGSHIQRMSRYTAFVAERMGMPDAYVESILYASSMHDIGKIGIPDSILLKPGKLSAEEWSIMKQHTIIGARILDGAEAEVLKLGATIALSHHEKWNGTGYPFGFKGEEIPLSGRITAIADVFDSLTSKRAYRKDDFTPNETLKIIEQSVGLQFDPVVFAAFKAAWQDILAEQEGFRRLDNCRRQEIADQQAIEIST